MAVTDLPLPLIIALGLLAYALVTCVLHVLAHRCHMRTRRHDLLVQIKTRRLAYERQLFERQKALLADYDGDTNVDILDEHGEPITPELAGTIRPEPNAPARRAA